MKKKSIIIVLLGLVLGIAFASNNPLVLLSEGYKLLLDSIARLSISSSVGNVVAWVITITLSFIPVCLFYFKGGKENKRVLISLILSIFIFSANLYLFNDESLVNPFRDFKILLLSLLYVSGFLAYYFEFYYKEDSHLHTLIMTLVYLSLLSYGMILGSQIRIFSNIPRANVHKNALFVISTLVIYFNINLLVKLEIFFASKLYTDLNETSLHFIKQLKIQADRVIAVIIYGYITSLALAFITTGLYETVNVGFSVPIVMILISVFINLYLKLLINALSVKEENDLFI